MAGPSPARRIGRVASLSAVGVLVFAGCGGPEPWLPPQPPQIALSMREMRFDFDHNLPRGRVVFKLRNDGHQVHRLSLVLVPKDAPPILRQLQGSERIVVDELANVPNRPPGSSDSFAVNLDAGRWAFVCFVVDPDGKSHAEKGMASEFKIR